MLSLTVATDEVNVPAQLFSVTASGTWRRKHNAVWCRNYGALKYEAVSCTFIIGLQLLKSRLSKQKGNSESNDMLVIKSK